MVWNQIEPNVEPPWLTGPIVAPSAHIVPVGHYNIEPYIFANAYTGTYSPDGKVVHFPTFWNLDFQTQIQIGLTSWLDFTFSPTLNWNYSQHQAKWTLGDLPCSLDIQLYRSEQDSWIPLVKLALRENIPIGKYRNLDPKKLTTDDGGIGSWVTQFGLVLGNLYHLKDVYYFDYRLALSYTLPAPVRLKGYNFYGGKYGTDIRFFPSQNFIVDFGFEITLSQTWAFAMDLVGEWWRRAHFNGSAEEAAIHPRFLKSQSQYSLAPAIEYNWSANLGVIAGMWFTVAGKNSLVYKSGVIAINYYK